MTSAFWVFSTNTLVLQGRIGHFHRWQIRHFNGQVTVISLLLLANITVKTIKKNPADCHYSSEKALFMHVVAQQLCVLYWDQTPGHSTRPVQVTMYPRLPIGRDGHLDQSEAYDISELVREQGCNFVYILCVASGKNNRIWTQISVSCIKISARE